MKPYNRPSHQLAKDQVLLDPTLKTLYDDLEEEYQLLEELIKARHKAGKTQAEVASLMGSKTALVGRLENLNFHTKHSPTLSTLRRYAHALGCRVEVKFIPKSSKKNKNSQAMSTS